jgi:hypothetical protein
MGATVTTRPAASGPSAPDHPVQSSGPPKERNTSLIVVMIIWGFLLALFPMGIVVLRLATGEEICL